MEALHHMAAGPAFRALDQSRLAKAARTMPNRKAAGLDHWTVPQLKRLPDVAWESLAVIVSFAEAQGAMPAGLRGAKLVFLPKGKGSAPLKQRPIGVLPLIYRIWARARLWDVGEACPIQRAAYEHGGGSRAGPP